MIQLGKVYGNLMVDLTPVCNKLRSRVRRILGAVGGIPGPEAEATFERAGRDGKTAVVMLEAGVGAEPAARALRRAGGRVRDAVRLARNAGW
jgi:N-acetylmuramic acid 6-phosphate etherase